MIRAQVRIQLPEHLWVADLSREFSATEFKLLSGFNIDGYALELGEVVTDTPGDVVAAMRAHPKITTYDVLESDSSRVLGKYETPQTDLYEFAASSALTIEFPVSVRDGWYRFDLTGTRAELDELREALEATPGAYELESLVTRTEPDALVTDRQRDVLEAALHEGYFAVPRECTLADVADAVGADKSTVSEIVGRGESRRVTCFLTGPESHP
jgi:predicted DNA binding protein